MTFKEAHLEDLEEVFFDLEELAETHMLDGKEKTVVLEDLQRQPGSMSRSVASKVRRGGVLSERTGGINPKESAVSKSSYRIYLRTKDAERRYTTGAMIDLDGKKLFVQEVTRSAGVYLLTVGDHSV